MKFSSSILFLGCCLIGQLWIVTGMVYERPSIHLSPSSVVPFEGSFSITCNVKNVTVSQIAKFTLYKKDNESWIKYKMVKQKRSNVYFRHYAKPQDSGTYKCSYCACQTFSEACSMDSDTVDVFIRAPSLWKPSIKIWSSVTPYVNENATIVCEGMMYDLNFTLHRFGNQISVPKSVPEDHNDTAKFTFSPLKVKDGGIYTCEYHQQKNKFVLSVTSDPLELNLTDSSLVKPTIELRSKEHPALGKKATIECRGPETGLNFALQRPNNSTSHWLSESLENTTKFFSAQVRLEDEGNYTCRYHHRHNPYVWSEPSEPVLLVVRALPVVEVSIRMVVAVLVLLATVVIAAEAIYSSKKEKEKKRKATLVSPPE